MNKTNQAEPMKMKTRSSSFRYLNDEMLKAFTPLIYIYTCWLVKETSLEQL